MKWEFLFSGFTSSQFAFLMIDFLPWEGEGLCRNLGTLALSLTSSQQEPGYVQLRLFLSPGNPRPRSQTESWRLFVTDLRARGGDREWYRRRKSVSRPKDNPASCRNKEWVMTNV